ncbi:hypothetical protein BDQ12DRAFT_657463 [Crucibulum laeve]|uniref:Uncharacterized protein n=1 Tax=Crucibulum laeve TaxID=68775 RepID=A0A5C3LYJ6_9AGAR|nr:hypothetical protein BDQ12DRAFT_657463 [Crucibulum laeve]
MRLLQGILQCVIATTILASPASHLHPVSFNATFTSNEECVNGDQGRDISDIVWGCLATIFACTWISVHPNIPALDDKWVIINRRRFKLMFWAIVAPEITVFWAMRQWFGARRIAGSYIGDKYEWGITHGYFVQMGGFMLVEDSQARTLSFSDMEQLERAGRIDWPTITAEEISDRSKSDPLAKGFVLIQTSWFIIQCLGRYFNKCTMLTELELVTLAFAVLNGIMYFFWWNKPLDVRCPILIRLKQDWAAIDGLHTARQGSEVPTIAPLESNPGIHVDARNKNSRIRSLFKTIFYRPAIYILRPFHDMTESQASITIPPLAQRTPTFYALNTTPQAYDISRMSGLFIAIIFGIIHCGAWWFHFPTNAEKLLWRTAATVITVVPLLYLLFFGVAYSFDMSTEEDELPQLFIMHKRFSYIFPAVITLCLVGILLYIPARLTLLVQAVIALRDLVPEQQVSITWTTFVPHI